jgi:hypothetical protein
VICIGKSWKCDTRNTTRLFAKTLACEVGLFVNAKFDMSGHKIGKGGVRNLSKRLGNRFLITKLRFFHHARGGGACKKIETILTCMAGGISQACPILGTACHDVQNSDEGLAVFLIVDRIMY